MTPHDLYDFPVHGPKGRIAALRRELHMKQSEFAEAIGTSRETVSHWENVDKKGEPRQRTTRRSAAAVARLAEERLAWNVDGSFFHRDEETAYDQLLRLQKKDDALLEKIHEQLAVHDHDPVGRPEAAFLAQRFAAGDIVGWCDLTGRPHDRGEVLAVEDRQTICLDFYCDPCDAHWSIRDDGGYWRTRILDGGDYPRCPLQESPDCDARYINSYITAIRTSQNVTVDFARFGGPGEFSSDHLRLLVRKA